MITLRQAQGDSVYVILILRQAQNDRRNNACHVEPVETEPIETVFFDKLRMTEDRLRMTKDRLRVTKDKLRVTF